MLTYLIGSGYQVCKDIVSYPFKVKKLWSEGEKTKIVVETTTLAVKTGGMIVLYYDPFILLRLGLPIIIPFINSGFPFLVRGVPTIVNTITSMVGPEVIIGGMEFLSIL